MDDNEVKKMREFYQKEIDRSVDGMDYLYVGLSMIDNEKFDDKPWVRNVFLLSVEKVKDSQECLSALDSITKRDCFEDKTWARKLFILAFKKLDGTFTLHTLADHIANESYLGDKNWARDVYNLAYRYADDGWEMIILAASVQKYLNDSILSQEILKKAHELFSSKQDFNFLYEVFFDKEYNQLND